MTTTQNVPLMLAYSKAIEKGVFAPRGHLPATANSDRITLRHVRSGANVDLFDADDRVTMQVHLDELPFTLRDKLDADNPAVAQMLLWSSREAACQYLDRSRTFVNVSREEDCGPTVTIGSRLASDYAPVVENADELCTAFYFATFFNASKNELLRE